VNRSFEQANFDKLYQKALAHLQGKDVYVQDCFAGADREYRVPIRVITEYAWHSLFARNMFVRPDWNTQAATHVPAFTVINVPTLQANPETDGTNSPTFILMDFGRKLIPDRWHKLCGRDEKIHFYAVELFVAPQRRTLDALFGQYGEGRRYGDLFRTFGHWQNHALG
jgi:phosphoenolpyruvate carboxykinase (ATP)